MQLGPPTHPTRRASSIDIVHQNGIAPHSPRRMQDWLLDILMNHSLALLNKVHRAEITAKFVQKRGTKASRPCGFCEEAKKKHTAQKKVFDQKNCTCWMLPVLNRVRRWVFLDCERFRSEYIPPLIPLAIRILGVFITHAFDGGVAYQRQAPCATQPAREGRRLAGTCLQQLRTRSPIQHLKPASNLLTQRRFDGDSAKGGIAEEPTFFCAGTSQMCFLECCRKTANRRRHFKATLSVRGCGQHDPCQPGRGEAREQGLPSAINDHKAAGAEICKALLGNGVFVSYQCQAEQITTDPYTTSLNVRGVRPDFFRL